MHLRATALSMKLSALSAKHSSFQYRELKMRFRVVLSSSCVAFFTYILLQTNHTHQTHMDNVKPLRLSASIILSLGDAPAEADKFLMLVRKPHMSFENSLVFPGGACDKEDEAFSGHFLHFARITAIRELMEETGILLLPPGNSLSNLAQLRRQYGSRELKQLNALVLSLWEKNLDLLAPMARFLTPQIPRMSRFDCVFYLVLPGVQRVNLGGSESLLELSIHVEESSRYYWTTARDCLQMMQDGRIFLPPPQRILLAYLASVGQEAYHIRPAVEPFLGQFGKAGEFVLPGDRDYDYEWFEQVEPNSRLLQELKTFMRNKKEASSEGNLCRVINVTRLKQQQAGTMQILLHPARPSTILSYLPSSVPAAKL